MTINSASSTFTLNRFGLQFITPDTEKSYRRWRNEQNLPAARLAAVVASPTWLSIAPLGMLWLPGVDWFAAFWPGIVIAVPLLILSILSSYTRLSRYTTLITAPVISINGFCLLWVQTYGLSTLSGTPIVDPSSAVAGMMLTASFALFTRLPPLLTVAAITPFMGGCLALVIHQYQNGFHPKLLAFVNVSWLSATYFIVTMMSLLGERFLRRAFINATLLTQSRNVIRRYVPPALAKQIIEGNLDGADAPQRRRVTVLFSDIVGFTNIADRVEPEVMTQVVSEYMAVMSQVVDNHQGTVNEFIGDGLMALFGAPHALEPESQARSAIAAALAMHDALPELNRRWRKLGLGAALQIRIGINTGMASVGSYGSEGRMTYTAIGQQTNIAARIQSACTPGSILISGATWELVQDTITCVPMGEVECKGLHYKVEVYSPTIRAGAPAT